MLLLSVLQLPPRWLRWDPVVQWSHFRALHGRERDKLQAHLPNGQNVEQRLEHHPEDDQAQCLRIPKGLQRREWGRGVGQAWVLQVHLEDQEENPGRQEEQPKVGS